MSGLITAAAVSAVSVGVGAYESSQASGIANKQLGVQETQLGMEETQFNEQQQYAQQLQQLVANPSSITQTPGYEFDLSQGTGALTRSGAAGGFLGSGNQGAALVQYGQQFGMTSYDNQVQLLQGLAGFNAPAYGSSAVGAGGNAITANNSANTQIGNNLASLAWLSGRLGPNGGSLWGMGGSGGGITPSLMDTDFSTGSLFGGAGFGGTGFSAAGLTQ
jgi:hypothetical protein